MTMTADEFREHLKRHGGIRSVHTTPVTDKDGKIIGWQNIVVCFDGHRENLTPDEELAIIEGPPIPKGFRA